MSFSTLNLTKRRQPPGHCLVFLLEVNVRQYGKPCTVLGDSCQDALEKMIPVLQVNVPKTKRAYCKDKNCRKHTLHKVTQYKTGKASLYAQGRWEMKPFYVSLPPVSATNHLQVRGGTTGSSQDMVVRPSLFFTRRCVSREPDCCICHVYIVDGS